MNVQFNYRNHIIGQKPERQISNPMLKLSRELIKTDKPIVQPAPNKKETSTRRDAKDGTDTPKPPVKDKPSR